jgi:hypothetical protein
MVEIMDGDLTTYWMTRDAQAPGDWLEIRFPEPVILEDVELVLGAKLHRAARQLRLFVTEDGVVWRRVSHRLARAAHVYDQRHEPASQVLVTEPVRALGLRLEAQRGGNRRWGVAELLVHGTTAPRPDRNATPERRP